MPPVTWILNETIRDGVRDLTRTAPDYFWDAPASAGKYHHPACRGEHGLWAHTLMVCTVVDRMCESFEERGLVDRDHAIAAAILHDQRKQGPIDDPHGHTTDDHDELMADVCYDDDRIPTATARAVAAHNGPWYNGPVPYTPLDELVHSADMVASTAQVTAALPEPVPHELEDLDVPTYTP